MDIDDWLEYDYLVGDDDPPRHRTPSSGNGGNGGCLTVLIALIVCVSACLLC